MPGIVTLAFLYMAALEYLSWNALTAHPFKTPKHTEAVVTHPIGGNNTEQSVWFYDILFVSFVPQVRRVYISNITKNTNNTASVIFKDCDTDTIISPEHQPVIVPLTNHYRNLETSFAHYQGGESFAVKLIVGEGLVSKSPFSQDYPKELTELNSVSLVLSATKPKSIVFKTYNTQQARSSSLPTSTKFQIATYNKNSSTEPRIKLKHNLLYAEESTQAVGLFVIPGAGEGLYDPCAAEGGIASLYSINSVSPSPSGALFFKPSNCYVANVLSNNDIPLLGEQTLAPYQAFERYADATELPPFNAVTPGTTIYFENFCKPKCAPDYIHAFAHYLNRVVDGAKELDELVANSKETLGTCDVKDNILTATSFNSPNFFTRCNLTQNTSFRKYFHEGRNIDVAYTPTDIQTYKILEVISATKVKLANIAYFGKSRPFRVQDNGVVSNMNCATIAYNAVASTYLLPYFKVRYTTSESYNPLGVYTTYLSVVVAVYNPSSSAVSLRVEYNYSVFAKEGKYKIRKEDGVIVSDKPETYVGCREYVFIEAVFAIACGAQGGVISISVFNTTTGADIQIGQPYNLPGINGVPCPSTTPVEEEPPVFKLLQPNWQGFTKTLSVSTTVQSVLFSGDIPSWLELTFSPSTHKIMLATSAYPTSNASNLYLMGYRTSFGSVKPFKLLYISYPVITAPLDTVYTVSSPLIVNKSITYTSDTPLLQIQATNMDVLSEAFPLDLLKYNYTANIYGTYGDLPEGLVFDKTSGKITGTLAPSIPVGSTILLYLNAANPAAPAVNPQIINLRVTSDTEQPYSGALYYYEDEGEQDTYSAWDTLNSWYQDTAHTVRSPFLPTSSNSTILLNNTSANIETWTAPANIQLNGHVLTLTAHPKQTDSNQNTLCAPPAVFSTDVTPTSGGTLVFQGHINII